MNMKTILAFIAMTLFAIGDVQAAHPTYSVDWTAAKVAGINITTQGQDKVTFFMSAPLDKNGSKLFRVHLVIADGKKQLLTADLTFQEIETGRASWQLTLDRDLIKKSTIAIVYGPRGGVTYVIEMEDTKEPTVPRTVP
jgi:hypothetical protein